jgi:DHA2 family multidrug resistance protein
MGGDQLSGRQRHHDPNDGLDLVALRPQALLHDLGARIRRRLGVVRCARSLEQMVVFRLIQGAAGAAMIPSSQAILMETFPPAEQGLAMAMWGVGLMAAPVLGPTLGGWITDNWNWRWNFYINVPIGLVAYLMVSAFVHDPHFIRERRARGGKVDYLGIILLVLSLASLQIVLDRGQRADWFAAPWVIYATGIAALSFILLIVRRANR